MLIHIHLPSVTVTARGDMLRGVTCEHCGCQYLYKLSRQVYRTRGVEPTNAVAVAAMSNQAQTHARKAIEKAVDPIPCPDCGHLQRNMVRSVKLDRLGILLLVAFGALAITGILAFLANMPDLFPFGMIVPKLFGAGAVALLVGAAITIVWQDLNSARMLGQRHNQPNLRAIRRQDFPDLPPELFNDPTAQSRNSSPDGLLG
jgi:hypothetical protein